MSSPTFRPIPAGSGTGDMTKAVYDTDDSGKVDDSTLWDGEALPEIADATGGQVLALKSDKSALEFATVDLATKVVGPASATDNAIARYDATTGKLIQDSLATVSDTGSINVPAGQSYQIGGQALYPNGIISPVIYNRYTGQPSTLTLSSDIERRFFKDDFSVDSLGQYTGDVSSFTYNGSDFCAGISSSVAKYIQKSLVGNFNLFRVVSKFSGVGSSNTADRKIYFGTSSQDAYFRIYQHAGSNVLIFYNLVVGAYNSGGYTFSVGDSATWSNTPHAVSIVVNSATSISVYIDGVLLRTFTSTVNLVSDNPNLRFYSSGWDLYTNTCKLYTLDALPSVAYTDPCSADLTTRLATVTGTDAAFDTDHYNLVANTDSKYRLKSYQFGSGSRVFKFTLPASCNDGDYINMRFCSIGDLSLGYGVGVIRVSGAWNAYTVKDTTGATGDVITDLADGNTVYIEVERSSEQGVYWYYIYESVKPTSPTGKIFDASYQYGYSGIVCHSASGSKTFVLNSIEVRSNSLIGETNVPAIESNFYFKDDFAVDSIGRFVTTGTWAIGSGVLSCSSAGNCTFPFKTTVGIHTFTPTLADGTHYYYFGGYRLKFVATGGNSCVITLQTTAGVAVGSGSLTVTTTSGAFSNPVVITEATTSISVTVTGATGTITPGTTTSANASPKFTIGAATSSIDNYIFTGTRYYNKPMLRGCQIGEYYNGTAAVPCTRFVDDCNWDTSAEYTEAVVVTGGTGSCSTSFGAVSGGHYSTISRSAGATVNDIISIDGQQYSDGLAFYEISADANYLFDSFIFRWAGTTLANGAPTNCFQIYYGNTTSVSLKYINTEGVSTTLITGTTVSHSPNLHIKLVVLFVGASIYVWADGSLLISYTSATQCTSGKVGFYSNLTSSGTYNHSLYNVSINALESQSNSGISLSLGGVPHGARYATQEYAVKSFVNAARYGEYKAITAAKTTDYGHEDIELYLKNSTDSSNITNDASETVAIALTDNNYTNVTKDVTLNADDQSDTITMQVRRKTAATDNTPACFVDFLALIPTVEV